MLTCNFMSCKLEFDDAEELVAHMCKRHRLSEFSCTICGEKFDRPFTYKRHLIREFQSIKSNREAETIEAETLEVLPFMEPYCSESHQEPVTVASTVHQLPDYNEVDEEVLQFSTNIFKVLLDLYGSMRVTKKMATDITLQLQNVICIPILRNLLPQLKCEADMSCLKNYIENINVVFADMNTEYKFKELLKKNNLFFEAEEFGIASEHDVSKGYLFPLVKNLESLFLSKPDLLLGMLLKYEEIKNDLNADLITNLINQEVWRKKTEKYQGKTILPIFLYQDDIEINNPLGSKAGQQKISTVYVTLPLLDSLHISKLAYQIPASLTLSNSLSAGLYSNYYNLSLILKDLEENGIELTIFKTTIRVHFIVASVVGDNLAQNMMLGYTMSFSKDYFCRFCIVTKKTSETQTSEDQSILRWNLRDEALKTLGVKRDTPLACELETFNILDGVAVDVVHDFLEGIVKVEMSNLIRIFIKKRYFDLQTLNTVMTSFDQLSRYEKKNKCSKIKNGHLEARTLKMSASEICLFMNYFPLYVQEHIPVNDSHWLFFKILYKLLNFVMKPSFSTEELVELEKLVKQHHDQYITLKLGTKKYPKRLLPKHHIILHYVTSIKKLGPPKALWVMRLEGFHKCLKMYANATSSRKNILKSLADKLQLHNSQMYFENIIDVKIQRSKVCNNIRLQQYALENNALDIPIDVEIPCYYFIKIENIRFQLNDIVITENLLLNPKFTYNVHQIKHILYINKELRFLVSNLEVRNYNENIEMFEISFPSHPSYLLIEISEIIKLPSNIKEYKNKLFVNISNF